MSRPDEADYWFQRYGVSEVFRISDPAKTLYQQFGLEDGSAWELAHPRVLWPWFRTAILAGHGVGFAGPNWRQLTGVFVIHRGHILAAIRHRNSTARPDYLALLGALKLGTTAKLG
jgi:hypothetical protein